MLYKIKRKTGRAPCGGGQLALLEFDRAVGVVEFYGFAVGVAEFYNFAQGGAQHSRPCGSATAGFSHGTAPLCKGKGLSGERSPRQSAARMRRSSKLCRAKNSILKKKEKPSPVRSDCGGFSHSFSKCILSFAVLLKT